jgi:PAS domain-containing protein
MVSHIARDESTGSRKTKSPTAAVNAALSQAFADFYDPVAIIDAQWRFMAANQRALECLQRPLAELLGRRLPDVFPALVDAALQQALTDALGDMKPRKILEHLSQTDSWYEVELYPSPSGIVIHWREVTDEHKTLSFNDRLLAALESRLEFISQRRRAL